MPSRRCLRALIPFSLLIARLASAQSAPETPAADATAFVYAANEPKRALKDGKVIRAVRIAIAPTIDGRLGDEVWTLAPIATGFFQRDPDNGQSMTRATRIQIAYDDRFLYVAAACLDDNASVVATGLGRRDEQPPTDMIMIALDPRHDHQTGYGFQTNPSGWQGDLSTSDDDRNDRDYNSVWEVRTEVTETGWTAEFRIPFSQIRFTASPEPGQVWGFNVQRQIRRLNESGTWVQKPRGERGEVSLYGHLVFDRPIAPPRRLELTPYTLARSAYRPGASQDGGASAGVDLRVGLGTDATLSATINPDFGQVEQDPAVLNLSVFETFYPEKRPFFLEDSRTFVPPYGLFQLFHSRRIGRAPGLSLGDTEIAVDPPDETTILGAAKLTGKKSSWTYGALTATTGREYADVDTPITDGSGYTRNERLIEPATSYNVVRLQRDVMGSSNIGALVTGVFREKSEDAFTGGFDYNLRWDQNRTRWDGHWVVTHAPGTGGVKTSGGGVTNFSFSRKNLNAGGHYDHFGHDFRINDIGFFRTRANRNQGYGYVEVGQPDPWKMFRRIWSFTSVGQAWTDERLLFQRNGESGVSLQLRNFWNFSGGAGRDFLAFDDLDTRGGPPIVKPAGHYLFFNANSDSRKSWRFNFYTSASKNVVGGSGRNLGAGLSIQPSDRVQASVSTNYNFGHDIAQWIANEDADGDGTTDYVYGELRRDVLDLTVRATYAFNRDLTVQAYLQPFVAVGDYDNIRRLAAPRSFDFVPVTIATDPDFNTKSLRGNIVLRWEYVRGSTLFFVWDLSQADYGRPGRFSPLRDLGTAFGADATQVLMVKATYWLNR
ncbi:MAG TPA: DUF5916 domain-containing protein [Vicinamibacterales bacterium]|nr:DUF5916 domain-containing protein [Vicinamibacterales bacterium]